MRILLAVGLGCLLDLVLGDPLWMPHPVRWMGRWIAWLERALRRRFPDTPQSLRAAGCLLAAGTVLPAGLLCWGALSLAGRLHPLAGFLLESWVCCQCLAARSLASESLTVLHALKTEGLPAARRAVGRIVGRDTQNLDEAGVTRAAVETVAENTSDGVVAPLFWLLVGGAPLGLCYKAVNTLDSMVGYRNERYLDFGRCSARLDDLANWLPARLAALLMILAAFLTGEDGRGAAAIWRRDRRKHPSPNSAQTESACAGALGVQLAGPAYYGGVLHEKPTLGDCRRPICPQDIRRAVKLMWGTSFLALAAFGAVRLLLIWLW